MEVNRSVSKNDTRIIVIVIIIEYDAFVGHSADGVDVLNVPSHSEALPLVDMLRMR